MKNNKIFRKVALERLSSPDQLDDLMEVTKPRAWLALSGIALLFLVAIVWSVAAELPSNVQATGLLIHKGGLQNIMATASGQITDILVERGDIVKEGQIIARLSQPHLLERIHESETRIDELKGSLDRLKNFGSEEQRLRSSLASQRHASINSEINAAKERLAMAQSSLASQSKLLERGLTTKSSVDAAKVAVQQANNVILQLRGERRRASLDSFGAKRSEEADIASIDTQIVQAEARLGSLVSQLEKASNVVSSYNGRVVEVRFSSGVVIQSGAPIVSLEPVSDEHQELEALIYINAAEGKKVKVGQRVQVVPSVVKREEFGVVWGEVTMVAEFPSTSMGMLRVLGNKELVETYLKQTQGAPIAVHVRMNVREDLNENDQKKYSGYEWSSGFGPLLKLTSGTPCDASINVSNRRPIMLLLPGLREKLGI